MAAFPAPFVPCWHMLAVLLLSVAADRGSEGFALEPHQQRLHRVSVELGAKSLSLHPHDPAQHDEKPVSLAEAAHLDVPRSSVSHTTYSSVFDEIADAGKGAIFGIVLIFIALPLLWFNERRDVEMWSLFGRAREKVRPDLPAELVDPSNEGELVHVSGTAATQEVLRESTLGISVSNCAKLICSVQMFQWVEQSKKEERDTMMGGKETTTTYSYHTDWSEKVIDSNSFELREGHHNPAFPVQSKELVASKVDLGAFHLPECLIKQMSKAQDLSQAELPTSVKANGVELHWEAARGSYTSVKAGREPRVGDLRVSFKKVPCGEATVLAVQRGASFAPLTMKAEGEGDSMPQDCICCCCCAVCCNAIGALVLSNQEVFEIAESKASVSEMFGRAESAQQVCHIALQVFGFLMLLIGWDLIFVFFPTFFRIIPLIGTWIQFFGNLVAHIAAFLFACCFWCITVAIAWLAMRPLKALCLALVAATLIALPTLLAHGKA